MLIVVVAVLKIHTLVKNHQVVNSVSANLDFGGIMSKAKVRQVTNREGNFGNGIVRSHEFCVKQCP